jgi:hypothetical protein
LERRDIRCHPESRKLRPIDEPNGGLHEDRSTYFFGCSGSDGEVFLIFGFIFNHRDLKRFSTLRRGQAYSWSTPHGVSHVPNQGLDVFAADLIGR